MPLPELLRIDVARPRVLLSTLAPSTSDEWNECAGQSGLQAVYYRGSWYILVVPHYDVATDSLRLYDFVSLPSPPSSDHPVIACGGCGLVLKRVGRMHMASELAFPNQSKSLQFPSSLTEIVRSIFRPMYISVNTVLVGDQELPWALQTIASPQRLHAKRARVDFAVSAFAIFCADAMQNSVKALDIRHHHATGDRPVRQTILMWLLWVFGCPGKSSAQLEVPPQKPHDKLDRTTEMLAPPAFPENDQ
ncbi:hypothetical protein BDW22DRAFT_1346801 [Trametopsis cervina]|nr:hypothetical protein BDW22DRAFT_1346801 [Trametopsis cervina]